MRFHLALALIVLTSMGAYFYGKKSLRLSSAELSVAWKLTLECVWAGMVFFALNLALAVVGILSSRVVLTEFVSLYAASDVTLLALSLLQGITFRLWRYERQR